MNARTPPRQAIARSPDVREALVRSWLLDRSIASRCSAEFEVAVRGPIKKAPETANVSAIALWGYSDDTLDAVLRGAGAAAVSDKPPAVRELLREPGAAPSDRVPS